MQIIRHNKPVRLNGAGCSELDFEKKKRRMKGQIRREKLKSEKDAAPVATWLYSTRQCRLGPHWASRRVLGLT